MKYSLYVLVYSMPLIEYNYLPFRDIISFTSIFVKWILPPCSILEPRIYNHGSSICEEAST